ncbi:MAG: hypothetical protein PUG54_08885 [Firmicutes bacterium]|nr:hypothetical protein [Bacillota bacterium]
MKAMRKFTGTTVITIMLVFIIAFCISGTVYSQNQGESRAKAQYYRAIEKEYVSTLRSLLEAEGYHNSGITMNYVTEESGPREYTVIIHHKGIGSLSDEEKDALISQCQRITFPETDCNFYHKFLETDL